MNQDNIALRHSIQRGQKNAHDWRNNAFFAGSLITAFAQGYMVGAYIHGFNQSWAVIVFSLFTGLCVVAGYCLIGACWLIMKTESTLQKKAVYWARRALFGTVLGIAVVSISTPLVSARIFEKWFSFPNILLLAPIPLITGILIVSLDVILRQLPKPDDRWCWLPFIMTIGIFVLCFLGLAYSFYPYIVPERLKIVDAAAAPESLIIILVGALVVLPVLLIYTIIAYRVFHGKAQDLNYD